MQSKKLFDLRFSLIIFFLLLLCGLSTKALFLLKENSHHSVGSSLDVLLNSYREVGNQLESSGILEESIEFYEKSQQSNEKDPQLIFRLAQLYDQTGNLEKALSRFILAKQLAQKNPSKNASIIDESSKEIVALLEKLRKYSAAKRELQTSTSLEAGVDASSKGGVVVATINEKKIYLHDFEKFYDELPAEKDKEKNKPGFLQKYIADEILMEKAKRMKLEKDPKLIVELENIKKQLFIQKIMEKELGEISKIDKVDLKNYYTAHVDKYEKKPYEQVEEKVKLDYQQEKLQGAYSKMMEEMLKTEKVQIYWDKLESKK